MGRFAKIAMAAAAIVVFFMVAAMPGIIRNKNTNQPAAQVEKSTEEDNLQTMQVNQEMKYYLLLGTDGRTDKKAGTHADAIVSMPVDSTISVKYPFNWEYFGSKSASVTSNSKPPYILTSCANIENDAVT